MKKIKVFAFDGEKYPVIMWVHSLKGSERDRRIVPKSDKPVFVRLRRPQEKNVHSMGGYVSC